MTHTIMGSVEKRYIGVAGATLATMRVTGQNISMGLATLVLAIVVGRHVIEPADYPDLLTSVRITFAIFTVLCVFGVAASLVGPRSKRDQARGSGGRAVAPGQPAATEPEPERTTPRASRTLHARALLRPARVQRPHLLSTSDCQGLAMADLLAGADHDLRARWENLPSATPSRRACPDCGPRSPGSTSR